MEMAAPMPARFRRAPRLLALLTAPALVLGLTVAGSTTPAIADPPLAAELAQAQHQLNALTLSVDIAVEDYDAARVALAVAQRRSTAAQARVLTARGDLRRRQSDLGAIAATAYRTGGTDVLALMVSGSPADFLDRAASLDQLSRNQAEVVRAVGLATKQVAERQQAADSALADARALERRMAAAKISIERDLAAQGRLVDRLKAEQLRLERIAAAKAAAAARAAKAARAQAAREAAAAAAAAARARAAVLAAQRPPDPPAAALPGPPPGGGYQGPPSGRASVAVAWAYKQLGKPYVWAAAGPNAFDCSGLTMYVWGKAGVYLPHSSQAQFSSGPHVSIGDLRPGDLTFYGNPIHHVAIYVGGGKMIVAPHTGDVVKLQSAIRGDFVGAVRP